RSEEDHVVHGPLSEVVIDAKDVILVETLEQDRVEIARGNEVVSERLLDNDARPRRAARRGELLDDRAEESRRYREIMRRAPRRAKLFLDPQKRRGIAVVAI